MTKWFVIILKLNVAEDEELSYVNFQDMYHARVVNMKFMFYTISKVFYLSGMLWENGKLRSNSKNKTRKENEKM